MQSRERCGSLESLAYLGLRGSLEISQVDGSGILTEEGFELFLKGRGTGFRKNRYHVCR